MINGFVALHRRLIEWEWYSDHNVTRVFIHGLLRANYQDTTWRGHVIKRGQFITSISKLAAETGLSCKATRLTIMKLKRAGCWASEGHAQHTVITVLKYDDYQQEGKLRGKQKGKRGATEEQGVIKQENNKYPLTPTGASEEDQVEKPKKPRTMSSKTVTIDDITDWPNGGRDVWGPILAEWLEYKHDRRQDYKSLAAVHKLLVKFATPEDFQSAVDHSMASNSAGCFLPSVNGHAKPKNESLF